MKMFILIRVAILGISLLGGCRESSDEKQQAAQEQMLMEATSQTGMPAITNFRERKIVKDLLELRDKEGLVTWTYLWTPFHGKFVLLGKSIGYGIPYATQYTNPQKIEHSTGHYGIIPQADPNGLFSPSSAEGTWILMVNPRSGKAEPVYMEERISVFPFALPESMLLAGPAEAIPPPSDKGQ